MFTGSTKQLDEQGFNACKHKIPYSLMLFLWPFFFLNKNIYSFDLIHRNNRTFFKDSLREHCASSHKNEVGDGRNWRWSSESIMDLIWLISPKYWKSKEMESPIPPRKISWVAKNRGVSCHQGRQYNQTADTLYKVEQKKDKKRQYLGWWGSRVE